ncbi:NAD(P)-binding protein [Exidia glandulosa HHB12029]|uniref:NAD(P)-binding protein n=1 Tax=Exidia glandulosa HHB12029 TaxID=1314781 RepID=A0A165DYH3_EXIGL|nr:NAD(P)-binding protein [Exidia glandulosa HHB12029]
MSTLADVSTPQALFDGLRVDKLLDLTGLVAVITGGASGIGLMISTALLANGAAVHIVDFDKAQLDFVLKTYGPTASGRLFGYQADVSKKAEAKRIASAVGENTPYVTVLFNNAGIGGDAIPVPYESTNPQDYVDIFDKYDEESFSKVFAINTFAPFFMGTAFLPLLCASKDKCGGRFPAQIINTCSINSWAKDMTAVWGLLAYMLSKGAVEHLTKIMAHSLIGLGVRVNGFAPGLFRTAATSTKERTPLGFSKVPPAQFNGEEEVNYPGVKIPVRQFGRHEDIGALAIMLVTNQFMDGEVVCMDGGLLLRTAASY